MSTFEHRTRISRGPKEVWGIVGDFDNDERWRRVDTMTSDPGGPARVSTNTHEVLRFLSSIYVTDATVTTVGPGATWPTREPATGRSSAATGASRRRPAGQSSSKASR